ncbi:hypothetical protein [Streptomyces aquilus]|uniref:hypothetical protein n=1 Tax=Streptomyces aquilus TaxID=2548456 RepID=UPI0036A27CB1
MDAGIRGDLFHGDAGLTSSCDPHDVHTLAAGIRPDRAAARAAQATSGNSM